MKPSTRPTPAADLDLTIDDALRYAIAIGAMLILLVPAARGMHAAIGWLPLWLLGMPISAWWALHRCRLPPPPAGDRPGMPRAQRQPSQARRRARQARRDEVPRAA